MNGAALQVPLDVFEEVWPHISEHMDRVPELWVPWWTKEAIYNSIANGRFQLWAGGHGGRVRMWLVTQVAHYPAGNVLQGILVFGQEMDEYLDEFHVVLEKFARERNCFRMELSGRPGWSRKIGKFGFKMTAVTLSADVNETRTQ